MFLFVQFTRSQLRLLGCLGRGSPSASRLVAIPCMDLPKDIRPVIVLHGFQSIESSFRPIVYIRGEHFIESQLVASSL